MGQFNMPPGVTTNDIPGQDDPLTAAYANGRADQLDDDRRLLAWAYGKLMYVHFSKQDDALAMDEIKLILLGGA